jgi:hypothetical protein
VALRVTILYYGLSAVVFREKVPRSFYSFWGLGYDVAEIPNLSRPDFQVLDDEIDHHAAPDQLKSVRLPGDKALNSEAAILGDP